ncbi:MAG: acetate--CoA ligase family protein [Patescibacteria group bacterium]|jgi:acetyltransferase
MPKNLDAFFSPKSVAIIGASRTPEKVGAVVFKNVVESGFTGEVYPVNPNAENIDGKKCYKDVSELPNVPDLAIVAIPAAAILDVMNKMGEKGIKNVMVLSAGFKETGEEGAKLEKQLEDVAKKYEINLLGPNCLGFVNNHCPINATFARVAPQMGNIRFISQSGAIAASVFDWCASIGLGFSEFVTLGNKTVLNEDDILEYLFNKSHNNVTSLAEEKPNQIEPIGLYLESIPDGPRFLQITKQITQHDPIFIIKPGKTSAAANAMQSHTGAIAGADDVLDTALSQAGIVRCQTLEDFFDLSKAFSWGIMPKGPNVAIVSNAGGPAVISADAIIEAGLEVAKFDDETKRKLSEVLPRSASIINPVDVLGDALADRYAKATEIVLQTDKCDSLIVILTPQIMTQIEKTAEMIGEISKKYDKPVFCSFIGGHLAGEGGKILNKLKIPSFPFPERAIYSIGAMWKFKTQREENFKNQIDIYQVLNFDLMPDKIKDTIKAAVQKKQQALDNLEANEVVSGALINTPPTQKVDALDQALEFIKTYDYPVVLKLSSPSLLHKKSVGGVILDIRNEKQLEDAWDTLERKKEALDDEIEKTVSFQIQKEIPNGIEVIVGIKHDKTFGKVLLFGAGGSLAEVVSDKNLALLPIDTNKAKDLVQKSKVYELLKGSDREPPHALDKLYELIVRLSKIVELEPAIEEIEINPVVITINDVWAVDSKVVLKKDVQIPSGPKFKVATTLSAENLAGKIHYFEFEAEEPLKVQPGQYISVKVSDTRINCYSVAGQQSPTKFNLLVDSTPGGPGSKFFENLKVGDKMTYLGPFGNFILKPDEKVEDLLFMTTGCGLAPLKRMIEVALSDENFKQKVRLYIGYNNYEDIFLKDYFDKLAQENSRFTYQMAVNNPNPAWNGPTGFITELVKNDYPDTSKCAAYMCGNKYMIADVSKLLTERGCPAERVYTEKYAN